MTSVLDGVGVSPGRGAGVVVTMPAPVPEPAAATLGPEVDVEEAVAAIDDAVRRVQADLAARAARATG
ncbi:phosphoenolpyruvate--protein phosphotransferase, partial [Actinotalea fermentans ATCC 43279 = JCM 9966 = DSM 3133]